MKRQRHDSEDDEDAVPVLLNQYASDIGGEESKQSSLALSSEEEYVSEKVDREHPSGPAISGGKQNVSNPGARRLTAFAQEGDADVTPECFYCFPTSVLLRSYCLPTAYIEGGRDCDAVLLAHYVPSYEATQPVLQIPQEGVNSLGIAPGWRWDGVLRGRAIKRAT